MATSPRPNGSHRAAAALVGVLFLNAILFLFVGEALYRPVLASPDVLSLAHPSRASVTAGILLEWIATVPLILLIPVLLYPVLRPHGAALAVGYLAFRLLEAACLTLADAGKLAVVDLSRTFLEKGGDDAAFQTAAQAILAAVRPVDSAGIVYNLAFAAGALSLHAALYRSRLVPRLISGWGFLAAAALMAGGVLAEFAALPVAAIVAIWLPTALNEVVLALWLIARGFAPQALALQPIAASPPPRRGAS